MGLQFRKSIKLGPFRATFSKSGISTSVGVKGARITKRADGKTQTTLSIPGTGIYHTNTVSEKPAAEAEPAAAPVKQESRAVFALKTVVIGILAFLSLFLLLFLLIGCSADVPEPAPEDPPAVEETIPAASSRDEVAEVPEPEPVPVVESESDTAPEPEPVASDPVPEPEPVIQSPEPEPEPEPEPAPEPEAVPEPVPEPEPEPVVVPAPVPTPAPEPEPEPETVVSEPVTAGVIGNKNSKKFHEPSCSSVGDMKDKNKVAIESADAALAMGYEPCQRCH